MRSIGLFTFLLFFSFSAAGASAEIEAENFVRGQVKEVLRISGLPDINERYSEMRRLINRVVAIQPAAHFILGQHWRDLEKNDQQAYQEAFKRHFLLYFMSFSGLNMVDVTVDRARPGDGTDMIVEGQVIQKDFSAPTSEEKKEMTPKEKQEAEEKSQEYVASEFMLDAAKGDSDSPAGTIDIEFWLKARAATYAVFDIRVLGKSALLSIKNAYNLVLQENRNNAALALDDFILGVENQEEALTNQGLDPKLVPKQKKLKTISIQVPTAAPVKEEVEAEIPVSPPEPEKRKKKAEGPVLKKISISP